MENRIMIGRTYKYTKNHPEGCFGASYIPHKIVMAVPSYQEQVLIEAMDGIHQGQWFVSSLNNFLTRYELVGT